MLKDDSTLPCGILYVDDEEKALKYFRIAFAQQFLVFTAPSAQEGLEVLAREKDKIGIVLSDQRMPEMLGSEFLGQVRQAYPWMVRILTTAYSDLDSAIQAVNRGHIYQYVVKPWEIPELEMILRRAADYHYVLSERNKLLAIKMTTLQRILCSDRIKWLLLQSRSLINEQSVAFRQALFSLIKAFPTNLPLINSGSGDFEIGNLLRQEYTIAAQSLDHMNLSEGKDGADKALENFFSALSSHHGLTADNVLSQSGPDSKIRVRIRPREESAKNASLIRDLFGLLAKPQLSEVGVCLFELLRNLALSQETLVLMIDSTKPNSQTVTFEFSPSTMPNTVEAVIDQLAEKFSAEDIAHMSS